MIFISHNHSDKPKIEPIAITLKNTFGEDKVFYDSWSIRPGDGIIDKMNLALEQCKFFFYFISKNSLASEMVKFEWQNALMKRMKEKVEFIPVLLEDCEPPAILLQVKYINYFQEGLDVATRQIIDIIKGDSTFRPNETFNNLVAKVSEGGGWINISIEAMYYMEPQSQYTIVLDNPLSDIETRVEGISLPESRFENFQLNEDLILNIVVVGRPSPTSIGFPFIIKIKSITNSLIKLKGVLKKVSTNEGKPIPIERNFNNL
ncbi:MAG: toll/interleukin-1 receptor domain-containing protein [Candidatus Nitrosocosmicus sp.]|nr:toll/interleukin-1 receptor domain-containing protein [Candidatus Nitrosocosmicus sp.]MDN5867947.1 toll/interleukin-1 receptor domain-containing protein [Candidatus Nitrosocosmicus sp.]